MTSHGVGVTCTHSTARGGNNVTVTLQGTTLTCSHSSRAAQVITTGALMMELMAAFMLGATCVVYDFFSNRGGWPRERHGAKLGRRGVARLSKLL